MGMFHIFLTFLCRKTRTFQAFGGFEFVFEFESQFQSNSATRGKSICNFIFCSMRKSLSEVFLNTVESIKGARGKYWPGWCGAVGVEGGGRGGWRGAVIILSTKRRAVQEKVWEPQAQAVCDAASKKIVTTQGQTGNGLFDAFCKIDYEDIKQGEQPM